MNAFLLLTLGQIAGIEWKVEGINKQISAGDIHEGNAWTTSMWWVISRQIQTYIFYH